MKRHLNTSNLTSFADDKIFVQGDYAIIRNVASLKNHILASGMGELLYIPLGRVLIVTGGGVRLRINMQPCSIGGGQVVVIPENFFMEVLEVSDDYDAQIVSFSNIANPFRRWTAIPLGDGDYGRMLCYFDLLWQVSHGDACRPSTLDALIVALLDDIHNISDSAERKHPSAPLSASEQLTQRFFDLLADSDGTQRSVPDFAKRLCVTPNHLSSVVKQQTGQTVMQLLNAHALLQIKAMLCFDDLPIYEISDRFGFENPPAFTRFFKRETGLTPLHYRNGERV